ncbi:MAG: cadherin-like beta sandwich domain-containing protein [Lachnospiraceae bacterium]|nr:cadherin-like beta sandwich domain-containing protein [Lachnospiraceae bacterium]
MHLKRMLASGVAATIAVATVLSATPISNNMIYEVHAEEYTTSLKGKVNADVVNVRQGAGTDAAYLRNSSGNKVQLSNNHEVTIIGDALDSTGVKWYHISFYYGGANCTGYMRSDFVNIVREVAYTTDTDFETYLTEQGFPESYKPALRNLHALYPKWKFVADQIPYSWGDVLAAESIVGRSLVPSTSISSWKSTDPGAYNSSTGTWYGFDGSSWVAASQGIVAYCLDPRNYLDSSSVFMFEKLSYDENVHSLAGVENVLAGTFMQGNSISDDQGGSLTYAQAILNSGMITGVSPYHLASRIIQEMGINGGSGSISGVVNGYAGYYNYYNQGAYAHNGRSAIINGLIYAKSMGWNTRYVAIAGGAVYIGKNYINIGQNTLYYEKFDFVGTPYTHQYMSNILAPNSEAANVAKGYSEEMRQNMALVFNIPVYSGMPDTPCEKPGGTGSANNYLTNLSINGYSLTPTFSMYTTEYNLVVPREVSSVTIEAALSDSSASISGTGTVNLNEGSNTITVKVTATNGDVKNYTITIARGEATTNTTTVTGTHEVKLNDSNSVITGYFIDTDKKYVTGVEPETTVETFAGAFALTSGKVAVLAANGTDAKTGNVGTGDLVVLYDAGGTELVRYQVVIYGDVDGDGIIGLMDLLTEKQHMIGAVTLTGPSLVAGDADRAGDGAGLLDLLYIKRHMVGASRIVQQ